MRTELAALLAAGVPLDVDLNDWRGAARAQTPPVQPRGSGALDVPFDRDGIARAQTPLRQTDSALISSWLQDADDDL